MADVEVWTVRLGRPDRRLARDAMLAILAAHLDLPAASLEIDTGADGKPYLPGNPVHFNLSHSRDIALVALSGQAAVGIDVEHPRELRSPERLARRICSRREQAWLRRLGGAPNAPGALLRLWVRKEAVVKGTGDGLTRELNEVDVLEDVLPDNWLCVDLPSPAPGYPAALAVRAQTPSISLRQLQPAHGSAQTVSR